MPALLPLYAALDPDTYGGAVLLGVDGVCIISHGSSGATAMVNAIARGAGRWSSGLGDASTDAVDQAVATRSSTSAPMPARAPDRRHRAPLERDEIFEIVRDRLADILEIEPTAISEGQSFVDDLDADSLALIELVEALEEELSERIVGLPHRGRGPRRPEDRARRRRLRARQRDPGGRLTLDALERARLGYSSPTPALLSRAMAHRSWCAEHPGTISNERLEFLGDAVLGWVVADLAFRRFTDLPEGELTGLRKGVVNATALAEVAEELDLGSFLLLGRGEDAAGGREKPSILSDALEAVLGAVYVDGGPSAAYDVDRAADRPPAGRDRRPPRPPRPQDAAAGSWPRGDGSGPPVYVIRAEGPDHAKRFFATVRRRRRRARGGDGRSKKVAEQAAAAAACAQLDAARSDDA